MKIIIELSEKEIQFERLAAFLASISSEVKMVKKEEKITKNPIESKAKKNPIESKAKKNPIESKAKKNPIESKAKIQTEEEPKKKSSVRKFKHKECDGCHQEFLPTSGRQMLCHVCRNPQYLKKKMRIDTTKYAEAFQNGTIKIKKTS
jgi:hypothetical protein